MMRLPPFVLALLLVLLAGDAPRTQAPAPPRGASLTSYDERANALIARMTLDEKIGQMTQPDQQFLSDPSDVATYFLGSVLSGGDSDPKRSNGVEDWADMYDRLQSYALKTRLKIPLLYGVDAVHGHSNVVGAVIFPHNIGLGATRNAALVEEVNRVTAKEVRATGINWAFAPCVAVPRDERWGRTYEGFSEDPALVAELGAAATRGLQGDRLDNPLGVLACAKHFAGDGGTVWGTGMPAKDQPGGRYPLDRGDTRLSEEEFKRLHMQGYVSSIREGVGSIMPSYSSWNGEKASGSKRLLTEILKGELGFQGFLISDYDAIDEIPGDYRSDIKTSVNAGMDMFMVPQKYKEFISTLKALVEADEVPISRIDDAVRRILRVKLAMGLMEPGRSHLADRSLMNSFGSAAHRAVARRAVRESLVLLKNERSRLPLRRDLKRVHVSGPAADDLGKQMGGWTVTWQGRSGQTTVGTTVLGAVQQTVSPGTKVTHSTDGSGAEGADVALVVVGEEPYAEFFGDRADLSLSKTDQNAIARAKRAGVPVVVVLFSGRPLILGDALAQADAFVAAWLPGTEGHGITDVLFGDYKPTGKLPMTWPRTMKQIPINVGDANYDPLFPYGFGLTY